MKTKVRLVQLEIGGQRIVGLVPATLTDAEIVASESVAVTFSDEHEVATLAPVGVVLNRIAVASGEVH